MPSQPYGYTKTDTGNIIEHELEQSVIALMRDYRSKGMSVREIAATLAKFNIKTRTGKNWHFTQVSLVLKRHQPTKAIGFRPNEEVAGFLSRFEQQVINVLLNKLVEGYMHSHKL